MLAVCYSRYISANNTCMNTEDFNQYVAVEQEIKALEEKKQSLRLKILTDLKKSGITTMETAVGHFTVAHKRSWKYSPAIEKLTEKLKIAKHKEEEKGIAKPVESEYLVFKPRTEEIAE